jgi:beta-galactosidase
VDGPAEIAAVDNGNPRSYAPFQADTVQAFFGKAVLVLRTKSGKNRGRDGGTASGEGVKGGTMEAKVRVE